MNVSSRFWLFRDKEDVRSRLVILAGGFRRRGWVIARNFLFSSSPVLVSALLLFSSSIAWAGGVVSECTELNLRAAMAGGGVVTFACDGTIALSSTITNSIDTILDGSGYNVTISGGGAVRVFHVNTGVTFAVANLTIANGRASSGAGIFNAGGTVTATNSRFSGNIAQGAAGISTSTNGTPGQDGWGGALANAGVARLFNCTFTNNSAIGGAGGTGNSVYLGDLPTPGGKGGEGFGGAIHNSGLLTAAACTFSSNSVVGGKGGDGGSVLNLSTTPIGGANGGSSGSGNGGALFNNGVANFVNCTLASNTGIGPTGGAGGHGSRPPTPDYSPGPDGLPGSQGSGVGGIVDAFGQSHLTNCTLAFNSGTGNSSSRGGIAASGGPMVNSLLADNLPGGNCLGLISDLGHNLSSDDTCAFTNVGSLNGTFVLLGKLTNNGGPTATIALLPGCRAIDAGDTVAAPPTDQRGVPRPYGLAADIGAYEYNFPTNPPPSTVVSNCTDIELRIAMSAGGKVSFACDGTITLTNTVIVSTNTTLNAAGHQVAISGGNAVRIFYVNPGVQFTVANLTIANGRGGNGAGIFNDGGTVVLLDSVFRINAATAAPMSQGGAVFNRGGFVYATNCLFLGNYASLVNASARGGAIRNETGEINLYACNFTTNRSVGAAGTDGGSWQVGGPGTEAWGGAIDNSGTLKASLCTFIGNRATGGTGGSGGSGYGSSGGGNGGPGGVGYGGAICSLGALTLSRNTFSGNYASGGMGGVGGYGGLAEPGGTGGDGGSGAIGYGGAIFSIGPAQWTNNTLVSNSAAGGTGGVGGNGGQARMGIRGGNGGNGGTGGSAAGGAIADANGLSTIVNCTLALNSVFRGEGGARGNGGYGFYPGTAGLAGSSGTAAGGGISTAGATLANTLLATNSPGSNCFGTVIDAGHNLSSDVGCAFTNLGSLNGTDPKLGPLADNGGPTLTMALLPGSLAIDGGDTSAAPFIDQRGYPRPAGLAADIGAVE